jgi:hypothetical protein
VYIRCSGSNSSCSSRQQQQQQTQVRFLVTLQDREKIRVHQVQRLKPLLQQQAAAAAADTSLFLGDAAGPGKD